MPNRPVIVFANSENWPFTLNVGPCRSTVLHVSQFVRKIEITILSTLIVKKTNARLALRYTIKSITSDIPPLLINPFKPIKIKVFLLWQEWLEVLLAIMKWRCVSNGKLLILAYGILYIQTTYRWWGNWR